jgi:hypothetical protein
MIRYYFLILTFLFLIPFFPGSLYAQINVQNSDTLRKGAVKIFLDCQSCDMNYTREQINFANFVRDVKEAQVYILITQQNAGSGGSQFTFSYQGSGIFKGMNDTLVYTSNPDETSTIVREKKTNMLKLGLMRYVAKTPVFSEIAIVNNSELEREEVIDKWNNWVFALGTEPRFQSEESDKQFELRNSLNITKVTPDIKIELEMDQNYSQRRVIDDDGGDTTYITNEFQGDNLFVKSLGEHWSTGIKWNIGSSTRKNYDLSTDLLPSIEYDLFPYSEATRRQLRFLYSVGLQYNNYIDSPIYNQVEETLFKQELNIAFKCLILKISGGIAYLNDQINLKKGGISDADRLLQLRELSTQYRIEGGIGLTYTFGSIYNNVVNPRFGFGGGGGAEESLPDQD